MRSTLVPGLALAVLTAFGGEHAAADLTDGLIAHWRFSEGEGATAYDSSGNGHDCTIVGDPDWIFDDLCVPALHFDGNDDRIECGSSVDLQPTSGLSVSLLFKTSEANDDHVGVVCNTYYVGGGTNRGYKLSFESGDTFSFIVGNGSEFVGIDFSDPDDGVEHHVVGTYDGSSIRLYKDGGLVAGPVPASLAASGDSLYLAFDVFVEPSENRHYAGLMDEVRIYDRALTAEEVEELYLEPCVVPTVSEWGLLVMAVLVLTAGTLVLHRRRPAKA